MRLNYIERVEPIFHKLISSEKIVRNLQHNVLKSLEIRSFQFEYFMFQNIFSLITQNDLAAEVTLFTFEPLIAYSDFTRGYNKSTLCVVLKDHFDILRDHLFKLITTRTFFLILLKACFY